jgi:hypothetical protein
MVVVRAEARTYIRGKSKSKRKRKSKSKRKSRSRSLRDDSQKDKGKSKGKYGILSLRRAQGVMTRSMAGWLVEWRECFFLGRVVADG